MAKPQPKRIASDACPVNSDGAVFYPHEGEWVDLVVVESVAEMRSRVRFGDLATRIDAIKGEANEGRRFNQIMDEHFGEIAAHLARRVFAWDWTDDRGAPLPPPANLDGSPNGLLLLRSSELYWLMNATGIETPEQRKND